MVDLSVEFVGLSLKNPFLIGAGQHTTASVEIRKHAQRIADAGWAGVVPKTYIPENHSHMRLPYPHLFPLSGKIRRLGMQNCGPPCSPFRPEEIKKDFSALKKAGLAVIASIGLITNMGDWTLFARTMEECGADALEVNFGCPIISPRPDEPYCSTYGADLGLAQEAFKAAKKECDIPILVKLSPIIQDVSVPARLMEQLGASGISVTNTILGLSGIDIDKGIPLNCDVTNRGIFSGLSGPIIKPIGLRCVAQVAKAVKIPVSGIGGITDWESAVEYIMVGAKTIQTCTGVMWRGFGLGRELVNGVTKFMERKGYDSIEDFVGIALQYIVTDHLEMNQEYALAVVDQDECTGCGICATACTDTAWDAITIRDKLAVINKETCTGCGLCRVVCPISNCITIKAR